MNIENLSIEERQKLLDELKAKEAQDKEIRLKNEETYKSMAREYVSVIFPTIVNLSTELVKKKKSIRDTFAAVIELKQELYGVKEGQMSHQFMSADGTKRIRIGYNINDNYDDTVEVGIAKVKEYINSLATDEKTQMLVGTILQLLSKDKKGTIKASKVLQLQKMAEQCGDANFIEGVRIIRDSYHPTESKNYIRAQYKDYNGAWKDIPLGITEA